MDLNTAAESIVNAMREYNAAFVAMSCCPVCQEYDKERAKLYLVNAALEIALPTKIVSREGFLVLMCQECEPDPDKLSQDIMFWSKTGFAHIHTGAEE